MIWMLIAAAPIVLGILYVTFKDPAYFLTLFAIVGAGCGLFVLFLYGGWEVGWFESCGTFWESFNCH